MTAYELELVTMAKNRGDSISRQLADIVCQQQAEIESLGKAFEGERKYARYLSKLCLDNKIPIGWSF